VTDKLAEVISIPLSLSLFVWLLHFGFDLMQASDNKTLGKFKENFKRKLDESLIAAPIDVTLLSSGVLVGILLSKKNATTVATNVTIISICAYFIFLGFMIIANHVSKNLWEMTDQKATASSDNPDNQSKSTKKLAKWITRSTLVAAGLALILLLIAWLWMNK